MSLGWPRRAAIRSRAISRSFSPSRDGFAPIRCAKREWFTDRCARECRGGSGKGVGIGVSRGNARFCSPFFVSLVFHLSLAPRHLVSHRCSGRERRVFLKSLFPWLPPAEK